MSRVFLAEEAELRRTVVIKVIAPELAEGMSAERFTREVKLAARLQQANIVPVLSAGTADGLPYYTMPFVRGESLRARLVSGVPLSTADAVGILRDVGRALAYAHSEGVIHRDIKPENILLSGGAAVVTDFGIAKAVDASLTADGHATALTQAGASLGTPAYMAPEQALGEPGTDHRADIYSWGVVAWELLGGGHPFSGRSTMQAMMAAHVTEPAPSLAGKRPELSPALAALVMRCLEKDPAARPSTATELLGALDAASVSGERAPTAPPPPPPRARRRLAVWVGAGVVVLGAAAAGLALGVKRDAAPAAADRSLAVLPFTSSGGDTANTYLAEGIADEVTNTLSQVPGVRLAGRSSASRFAGQGASPEDVGRTLRVGNVETYETALTSQNALELFAPYDVILDGTDNFPTRYLVNDACVLLGKPNAYGSIFRFEGQASVFATKEGPCYRCLYPEPPPPGLVPSCAEGGVLGVLPGIIGVIQATETIKLITGIGEPLIGRFMIYDALKMKFRELKLRKDPDCPVCGTHPTVTKLIDYEQFCGVVPAAPEPVDRESTPPRSRPSSSNSGSIAATSLKIVDVREPNEYQINRIAGRS